MKAIQKYIKENNTEKDLTYFLELFGLKSRQGLYYLVGRPLKKIPLERVLQISKITGYSLEEIQKIENDETIDGNLYNKKREEYKKGAEEMSKDSEIAKIRENIKELRQEKDRIARKIDTLITRAGVHIFLRERRAQLKNENKKQGE